jgi:hypothetical protein
VVLVAEAAEAALAAEVAEASAEAASAVIPAADMAAEASAEAAEAAAGNHIFNIFPLPFYFNNKKHGDKYITVLLNYITKGISTKPSIVVQFEYGHKRLLRYRHSTKAPHPFFTFFLFFKELLLSRYISTITLG